MVNVMATLTIVCMDCGKVLGKQKDSSLTEDAESHGLCNGCATERRRQVEEYKKNLK